MVQTRRQLLRQALLLPLAAALAAGTGRAAGLEIVAEPDCLSRESAEGFRSLEAAKHSRAILLCGVSAMDTAHAWRLRRQAAAGRWIVWESSPFAGEGQTGTLREVFGISTGKPIALSPDRLYVQYRWPSAALTRSFCAAIPVTCSEKEAIALYGKTPVAMRRAIGRGGFIFLGSMLGPNLRAEDSQARPIGAGILLSGTA
ncbi:MAG: hypothetical protein ACRD6B_06905 [Bryobacteraceae bacterium]